MIQRLIKLLWLALAVTVSGCAGVQNSQRDALLASEAHTYNAALRWGELEIAAPRLDPRSYRGVKITDYDYQLIATGRPGETLTKARFTYYMENSARVRSLETQGLWWYDEKSKTWFLEDTAPEFGP